jgi:2',3'-cyclic-nucleotide 2'-phosphodiesterase (5'-nucleotidase family)
VTSDEQPTTAPPVEHPLILRHSSLVTRLSSLWIFHTNDFHGRLSPERAAVLMEYRREHPDSLLLDAGDAISAGNLGCRVGGEPILQLMNDLGYDAMTLGNRESHPRREFFPRKLAQARFPILCANVGARPGARLPTQPWIAVKRAGVRVTVMGLSVPMFTRGQWSQSLCDYLYDDPVATAVSLARELRPYCDLLIALTHLGLRADEALASAAPEIDLVIGGHSHTEMPAPVRVGKTTLLHTTAYARFVGRARLERDPDGWRVAQWDRLPIDLVATDSAGQRAGRSG